MSASAKETSSPRVVSVNTSPGGIPKRPVRRGEITLAGLAGDAHDHDKHNTPLQAVSLIDEEDLDDLRAEGFDVFPGATGENVTVRGLNVDELAVGDRLRFSGSRGGVEGGGGAVELELTKRREPCFVLDAIDPRLKKAILGRCGFLAKVITPGELRPGATIELVRSAVTASTT